MAGTRGNTQKEIIINFSILSQDAIKNIQTLNTKIANLKHQNELLAESGQKNSETYIKNTLAIKDYTKALKANEKELQNEIEAQREDGTSLNAMRATLRSLTQQYAELSKEEREAAQGDELLKKIDAQRIAVEEIEHKMGDFGRQVGNYSSIWNNMPGPIGKVKKAFDELSGGTGKLSDALKNGGKAVLGFGKQLLKLMMNPIVALIAAIVAALKLLVDQFRKNDEAMTALHKVFAAFKPILDIINKAFQSIVGVLAKAAEAVAGFFSKVMSVIPGLKDYVDAEQDMVDSTDKLQESKRQYVIDEAKRNKEIAELNNKAAQSDKYTAKQRREFMEQAIALEKKNMEQKRANAKEELRLAQQEAALAVGAAEYSEALWDKLSDEVKDNLSQLTAAVENVEAEYEEGTRRMESRRSQFNKQEQAEYREYRKNRRDAEIALQDELLENYQNTVAAQYAKYVTTTRKEIAELKEQLSDADAKLDAQARAAIKARIKFLEDSYTRVGERMSEGMRADMAQQRADRALQMAQSVYDLTLENTQERYDAETQLLYKQFKKEDEAYKAHIRDIELQLAEVGKDLEVDEATLKERAKLAGMSVADYKKVMQDRKKELEQELKDENTLQTNAQNKFNHDMQIREKRHQDELKKIRADVATQRMENDVQKQLNDAEIEDERVKQQIIAQIQEDAAKKRLDRAKAEYAEMGRLSKEEIELRYGTYDAYNLAMEQTYGKIIKLEGDYQSAVKATTQAVINQQTQTINTYKQIANAISGAMGSMQDMFETMAEDNSEMADFATALAIMQIEVSTAVAIVEAIAAATKAGASFGVLAPAMIPVFIAELVGIVMGNIASTVTTLMKAKQNKPSTPKFWEGGPVDGPEGRDRVHAMLTKGEYVINKKRVDELGLPFLNQLNYGKNLHYPNLSGHYATGGMVMSGVDIDMAEMKNMMREAFTESLEAMPNPIVDVRQITDQQRRVQIKQNIAKV